MTETKDFVRAIIENAVEAAAKKGATLDFEKYLPKGKTLFTNRYDRPLTPCCMATLKCVPEWSSVTGEEGVVLVCAACGHEVDFHKLLTGGGAHDR